MLGLMMDRPLLIQSIAAHAERNHGRREVVSVYDTLQGVILLPDGWTGRTPAGLSVLVHEMVHHLQTVAELRYACPAEREKLAYEAQERWLEQFHTSLEREFGIDKLTLLVSTNCGM